MSNPKQPYWAANAAILLCGACALLFTTTVRLRAENASADLPQSAALKFLAAELRMESQSAAGSELAKPGIDPDAKALLDQVQNAYKTLKSIDMSGEFTVSVNTTGELHKVSQTFTSSFEQPNKFRHQMKPDVLVGCDGKNGYIFDEQQNAYLRFQYPSAKQSAQNMPVGLLSTLLLQNPSLLFAMTDTRVLDLLRTFGAVSRLQDVAINGVSCPVLQFGTEGDPNRVRLFIDPATHLVRRFVLDLKTPREYVGKPGTGDAAVTVNYSSINPQQAFDAKHFAWAPPAGATDVLSAAGAEPKGKRETQPRMKIDPNESSHTTVIP